MVAPLTWRRPCVGLGGVVKLDHAEVIQVGRDGDRPRLLPGAFPPAFLTTTEQGGINWYWRGPGFSVQLTVASAPVGKDTLYTHESGHSVIDEDVTAQRLADRLREFSGRWEGHNSQTMPPGAVAP